MLLIVFPLYEMDNSILFLLCFYWLLNYGAAPCQAQPCLAEVKRIVDTENRRPFRGKLTEGVNTGKAYCSFSTLGKVKNDDLHPFLAVDFKKTIKLIGIGIKGGPNIDIHKKYGFLSFQVYTYVGIRRFDAIRKGNADVLQVKTFPGLTEKDIVSEKLMDHMFDYPLETFKIRIHFKMRLGQDHLCLRIQFYQEQKACGRTNPTVDKCKVNKGGCDHACTKLPGSYQCTCPPGKKLWRDGLNCLEAHPFHFIVVKTLLSYEEGQSACLRMDGILSTMHTVREYDDLIALMKKTPAKKPFFIGLVDVDNDLSYSRYIDGSDVVFRYFQRFLNTPGSTSQLPYLDVNFDGRNYYSCRVGNEDTYLFTGFHGIEDFQFSSSPYLTHISLASVNAFGAARGRRGSKGYATVDSGDVYGSFWRPVAKSDMYLQVTMNLKIRIRGIFIFGSNCSSYTITISHKVHTERLFHRIKSMTVNSDSGELIFIKKSFEANSVRLSFRRNNVCTGYRWDLLGHAWHGDEGKDEDEDTDEIDECLDLKISPCDQICLNTPESYYCRCKDLYHLFFDEKTCLPDTRPFVSGPVLIKNRDVETGKTYFEFKDTLKSITEAHKYYDFFPQEKDFNSAVEICRKYGAFLPSFHSIFDIRLLYGNLTAHTGCRKWFLGLKGKSLLHSAWHDGSWVDFAIFEGSVIETAQVEQVAYMDKNASYMWNYGPLITTKACVMCQYHQNDCNIAILLGGWTIPKDAWTASKEDLLKKNNIDNFILNLANGLNYFTSTSDPEGFLQVDLQQHFLLHLLKCSSGSGSIVNAIKGKKKTKVYYGFYMEHSIDLFDYFSFITDQNGNKLRFWCGQNAMELNSTKFIPPILARFVRISWSYDLALTINFTVSLELYGCPAYSSVTKSVNPQCGTEMSLYLLKSPESYMCLFTLCPLRKGTCSPFNDYYKIYDRNENKSCSPLDKCASMPCDDGLICIDYKTNYKCHCPRATEGNCSVRSNMYVMTEKSVYALNSVVTIYMVVKNKRPRTFYFIRVAKDYVCLPVFKRVRSRKGRKRCSRITYHVTEPTIYSVTLVNVAKRRNLVSSPVNFRVLYPSLAYKNCLKPIQIHGVTALIRNARLKTYKHLKGEDLTFLVTGTTKCIKLRKTPGEFKIVKYEWTFSSYKFKNTRLCHSDEDFVELDVKVDKQDKQGKVFLFNNNLPYGHIKVCLTVTSTESGKFYRKEMCGFIFITVSPLKCVLEPSGYFQPIPYNKPVQLSASKSIDPNIGSNVGIIYQWFCELTEIRAECDFVRHLYQGFVPKERFILPETKSILKIPAFKMKTKLLYKFTVIIRKHKVVGATDSIFILKSRTSVPQLKIRCVFNCGLIVNPSKPVALKVNCLNCEANEIVIDTYSWIVLHKSPSGRITYLKSNSTTTNIYQETIVLKASSLKVDSRFHLQVYAVATNGATGIALYAFSVSQQPTKGSCKIIPKSGKALTTVFIVECIGFVNSFRPLKFKLLLKNFNKSDTLLYFGSKNIINLLTLPEGTKEHDFWQNLTVNIRNRFESSTSVHLSAQVFSPEYKNRSRIQLFEDIVKEITADNTTLRGDTTDFLRFLGNIEQMIGKDLNVSDDEKQQHKEILETLMKYLPSVSIENRHLLLQITDIVGDIISQDDHLSPNMAELVLNMMDKQTDYLFNISKNSPDESKVIAKKQMEILNVIMENIDLNITTANVTTLDDTDSAIIQKEKIKKIKRVLKIFEKISDAMLLGIQSEQEAPVSLITRNLAILVKLSTTSMDTFNMGTSLKDSDDGGSFALEMGDTFYKYNKGRTVSVKFVSLQVQIMAKNPYIWSSTAKNVNSPVMNILIKPRGELDKIELTNLVTPADVYISTDFSKMLQDDKVYTLNASYHFRNHRVLASTALFLTIPVVKGKTQIMQIYPINTSVTLQLYLGSSKVKVNTTSIEKHGMDWPIPEKELKVYKNQRQHPQLLFLPGDEHGQNYTVGVQVKVAQILSEDFPNKIFPIQVGIKSFTTECTYWNDARNEWQQSGCRVSPFTNLTSLHCLCDHLSVISGGIFIAPNTVDPIGDAALFLTFFDNPVVITVVVGVWMLYFLLLAWARMKDYEDLKKIGVTVLSDNNREDMYVYLICVVTDWWRQAGTTSRVFIYLCGRHGQSARHALCDRERDLFTSGAENWFLLKTPSSLGKIRSVVVWHDNSGRNPSWYLKEIVIQDIQTGYKWHCLYDEWLSVDKGYGLVHADIPAINNKLFAKKHFYQFSQTSSKDFRNGHIWLSIFAKSPTSEFTRKQRLVCALCILLSTMLANIMFHGVAKGDPEDQIDYGDFHLSLEQLVIGIQSGVIMFPINLLIIQMFNMLGPKPDTATTFEDLERATDVRKRNENKLKSYLPNDEKKKWLNCKLPYYFIYVAYTLAFSLAITCSYFIMLYGLVYGFNKSEAWLISFSTTLFQSVFVTQPIKVFGLALLLTIIFKHTVQYKSEKHQKALGNDEEYMHLYILEKDGAVMASDEMTKPPKHFVPPLSRRILRAIRKRILLDNRTREILQEILMYFSFVVVVLLVLLGHRDVTESFYATKSIENVFIEGSYQDSNPLYDQDSNPLYDQDSKPLYDVVNSEGMWDYLKNSVVGNIAAGDEDSIANSVAFLVGRASMRQIRVRKGETCKIPSEFDQNLNSSQTCDATFSTAVEETQSYTKNWEKQLTTPNKTMWTYQSADELNTLPIMGQLHVYPGGGFVIQLPRNAEQARAVLDKAEETAWIDEHTRVVIVEFTVYNPNVNLFTVVLVLFEYTNLGNVLPFHQIFTANFYHYRNQFETFVAVFEVVFIVYLLCFTYIEIKQLNHLKWRRYFSDVWNPIELMILALSYSIIGLFINRIVIFSNLMAHFSDSNYEQFVSFYTAAFYDSILTYVMAFLILITIIKFFKLLRFNVRLSTLAHTLRESKGKLTAYFLGIFGFVMAYAVFCYLIFVSKLEGYRSFGRTIITLFLFMLGQTDYYGVTMADDVLGPVFFFFFAMTFEIVLMHYFLIILMDAIKTTQSNLARVKTEVHMVDFIMKRFRLLLMLDKTKKKIEREKLYKAH